MQQLDLDTLLSDEHECGSFHDATIHNINIDYEARILTMRCTLFVGDPDSPDKVEREATAQGTLTFSGLFYHSIEPPHNSYVFEEGGLDISNDGSAAESQFNTPLPDVPNEAFVHWFFATNWNAFMFVAATEARWVWD